MDIPIPSTIPNHENVYYKEFILKKEASRVWTEYYAVLCDRFLIFNRKDSQSGTFLENNCTILELRSNTIVAYSPKTCYRFPFYIQTGKLSYHFKCETNLQRYRWVCALRLAINRKPPEPPPKFIPTRYSRGKLAKKEDKLSLKAVKSAATTRGHHSGHAARANGHMNGACMRANDYSSDCEDDNELYHSSHAVRLHKNYDSLLLTNKAAEFHEEKDETNGSVLFASKTRRTSLAADDLEIVDLDGSDHFRLQDPESHHSGATRDRSGSRVSNGSQTRKKVWINERPTDLEKDYNDRCNKNKKEILPAMDKLDVNDSGQKHNGMTYRVYPDNVKSFSWTSLGILRKQPVTRRENSAPPATKRERMMNRKNMVEKFEHVDD